MTGAERAERAELPRTPAVLDRNHLPALFEPRERPLAVLGNGPSLAGFDFRARLEGFDSIGMNAAYRYWERVGWYPDYYACLDIVVGMSHIDGIERLVREADVTGIRRLFVRSNVARALRARGSFSERVVDFDALRRRTGFLDYPRVTTGSHATLVGVLLGYQVLGLLGIDLDYVEVVPGARRVSGYILEIARDAANPNYFFDGYQRAGDRFHVPNATPGAHMDAWRDSADRLRRCSVVVKNLNPTSGLTYFDRISFDEAAGDLILLAAKRYRHPVVLGPHVGHFTVRQRATMNEMSLVAAIVSAEEVGPAKVHRDGESGWDVLTIHAGGSEASTLETLRSREPRPRVVLIEMASMGALGGQLPLRRLHSLLHDLGYVTYLSVWHRWGPDGRRRSWAGLVRFGHEPAGMTDSGTQGFALAFDRTLSLSDLVRIARSVVWVGRRWIPPTAAGRCDPSMSWRMRSIAYRAANLLSGSPRLMRTLQPVLRLARGVLTKRRPGMRRP